MHGKMSQSVSRMCVCPSSVCAPLSPLYEEMEKQVRGHLVYMCGLVCTVCDGVNSFGILNLIVPQRLPYLVLCALWIRQQASVLKHFRGCSAQLSDAYLLIQFVLFLPLQTC